MLQQYPEQIYRTKSEWITKAAEKNGLMLFKLDVKVCGIEVLLCKATERNCEIVAKKTDNDKLA